MRGLVRQYMRPCDALAVLMIAHPPKQSGAGARDNWWSGSTDWPAAARSAWALENKPAREGEPESTALKCHKASYGPAPDPVFLQPDWRDVARSVGADRGRRRGAGAPRLYLAHEAVVAL